MRDVLIDRAAHSFVGRTEELAVLLQTLEEGGPCVVAVHGMAGVGKSALLQAFAARARARGAVVVNLDCREIEPTERGFPGGIAACDRRPGSHGGRGRVASGGSGRGWFWLWPRMRSSGWRIHGSASRL